MSGYIILCPADTDWSMSPEAFIAKLKERWMNISTKGSSVPGIALCWHIEGDDIDLQGYFDVNGLTVGLDDTDGYAMFACWYRSLVPPEIPLIMMDSDYNEVYPLTPETKPDDILSDRIVLRPPPDPQILFTRTRKTSD